MKNSILILGGGLAGLTAALRLSELGLTPVVIDEPLPQAGGDLGGFAKFSGAKFSLPPAGMGLADIAGGEQSLWEVAIKVLGYLGIDKTTKNTSSDLNHGHTNLRSYSSILLTPREISELVKSLESILLKRRISIIKGKCQEIFIDKKLVTATIVQSNKTHNITTNNLIYAGGRLGAHILKNAGIITTNGKGIDIGVRAEFFNRKSLQALRDLGPDAKIIKNNCRTFCLNVPGEIYRYDHGELKIPGGVVSTPEKNTSNVGILLRLKDKNDILNHIKKNSTLVDKKFLEEGISVQNGVFGDASGIMDTIYGEENRRSLESFANFLNERKLVDWSEPHDIHIPLIDWHWETFSKKSSFKTSEDSIYCIGDASGHARGLLQAAISGYLAAEELSREHE